MNHEEGPNRKPVAEKHNSERKCPLRVTVRSEHTKEGSVNSKAKQPKSPRERQKERRRKKGGITVGHHWAHQHTHRGNPEKRTEKYLKE